MGNLVKKNKCFEEGLTKEETEALIATIVTEINEKIEALNVLIGNGNSGLMEALEQKFDKSGGTLTGSINSMNIVPKVSGSYNVGSTSKRYGTGFFNKINFGLGHDIGIGWNDNTKTPFFKIDDNSGTYFAVSSDNNSVKLNWTGNRMQFYVNGTPVGYIPYENS